VGEPLDEVTGRAQGLRLHVTQRASVGSRVEQ
jgi:hypothetical protein